MGEIEQQEIPLLTFNSLYNLLREERKTKKLQQFPDLFYEALEKFLKDKNNEILRLKNQGDNVRLKKEMLVLKNSKKISSSLLAIRCKKIANIAIENKIEGDILDEENILEKETVLFSKVKSSFGKIIKTINAK